MLRTAPGSTARASSPSREHARLVTARRAPGGWRLLLNGGIVYGEDGGVGIGYDSDVLERIDGAARRRRESHGMMAASVAVPAPARSIQRSPSSCHLAVPDPSRSRRCFKCVTVHVDSLFFYSP